MHKPQEQKDKTHNIWQMRIGLEVHAQIQTPQKLFSIAPTAFGANPNTQVDFLDAGFPGMLPVINAACVTQAIKTGLGLHGTINLFSAFDRKNYFYPDLPLGYQISQFYHPIVTGGFIDIESQDATTKRVHIERVHLETDAGKSIHDQSPTSSFIDLNRSGVGLMEIVTKPDMETPEEVATFFTKLRNLLRYLETCDGNMEEGSMRADVNVSINRPGKPWGTRCEIKNLNSVRFMTQAIRSEKERQIIQIEAGKAIVQETRLFDTSTGKTRSMRSKEEAHDYRYFQDPDLPPLGLNKDIIQNIQTSLPELPDAKKKRFIDRYGLSTYDAEVLTQHFKTANFYENALANIQKKYEKAPKILANWITSELFALLNKDLNKESAQEQKDISSCPITPKCFGELMMLILENKISGKIAKDILPVMWATEKTPKQIVREKGLEQIEDQGLILNAVLDVLTQYADKVTEYTDGKEKLFGFFVGKVMKKTAGKANPQTVNMLVANSLRKHKKIS